MKFNGYKEMQLALDLAQKAFDKGEVPVGAVITNSNGEIISQAYNIVEELCDGTAHAEILAIQQASKILKGSSNNRLEGCTLFVTLEPCAMCAAAISNSRISKLVYATSDEKGGAVENGVKLFNQKVAHKPEILGGIMAEESKEIIQKFFKKLR
jgi:tRNA(adenine34) deaminase